MPCSSSAPRTRLVDVTIFDDVNVDPCHGGKGFVVPRPQTVDGLAAALGTMPQRRPSKPMTSTIDGQAAT